MCLSTIYRDAVTEQNILMKNVKEIACHDGMVVPVSYTHLEENGRMMRMLAQHAKQVIRIWYGLPQVLK